MGGRGAACRRRTTGYRVGFCGPEQLDVQQRYAPAYYNPMMGIIHTSVVYCVWHYLGIVANYFYEGFGRALGWRIAHAYWMG